MNIIKKLSIISVIALAFTATSLPVYAEEAATVSAASGTSAIITNIEDALVEVSKSDFSAAQVKLKAARNASDNIANPSEATKKGHAALIQGQIQAKNGNIEKATAELNKALAFYKSL
jgi:hypothetical protein